MRWATLATVSPERATAAWKPSYATMLLASGGVLAVAEGAAGAAGGVVARFVDCVEAQPATANTVTIRARVWDSVWAKVRNSLNLILLTDIPHLASRR